MNGIHDMGGMHGMGPVQAEQDEPVFHEPWEGRVFALTRVLRLGGKWNIDMSRYSIEQIPPARYLESSYYERWLLGLERRLLESGTLSAAELASGRSRGSGPSLPVVHADDVRRPAAAPPSPPDVPPHFRPGDAVRTRNIHPRTHTRLPRYARGRLGTVDRDLGVQNLPDAWVANQEARPQHVYSVRFTARELWGQAALANDAVSIDLWEDYLDPA